MTYPTSHQPPITLRHLLNHSSCLEDNVSDMVGWIHGEGDPYPDWTELPREKLPACAGLIFKTDDIQLLASEPMAHQAASGMPHFAYLFTGLMILMGDIKAMVGERALEV